MLKVELDIGSIEDIHIVLQRSFLVAVVGYLDGFIAATMAKVPTVAVRLNIPGMELRKRWAAKAATVSVAERVRKMILGIRIPCARWGRSDGVFTPTRFSSTW